MEFYLVDDLECDLTIFHPYRTLMTLCRKEGAADDADTEAGEVGIGIDSGPRYWGTGEGQLELQEGALQMAWYAFHMSCLQWTSNVVTQVYYQRHISLRVMPPIPTAPHRYSSYLSYSCSPRTDSCDDTSPKPRRTRTTNSTTAAPLLTSSQ